MNDDGRFLALGVIGLVAAAGLVRRGSRAKCEAEITVYEPRMHEGDIDLEFEVDDEDVHDERGLYDRALEQLDRRWNDVDWDDGERMDDIEYEPWSMTKLECKKENPRRSLRDLRRQR